MYNSFSMVSRIACVCACVVFSLNTEGYCGGADEVAVHVTAILASHSSEFVDPELQYIADEVKTLFTYSCFRKIKNYTIMLADRQGDRITLPRDQDLVITHSQVARDGKIHLTVVMGKALNTEVSLVSGGHILIGGPSYDDGTLILLIEATN